MDGRRVYLIVAGEPSTRAAIARSLAPGGHSVLEAANPDEAEAALSRALVDAVLADVPEGSRDLEALLHVLHERAPDLPVVALHEPAQKGASVEAWRHGVHALVPRGAEAEHLAGALHRAAEHHALRREVALMRRLAAAPRERVPLLGRSQGMREINRQVDAVASKAAPVLIMGAPGTGKNLLARELHARSPRSSAPFLVIACHAVHPVLLESQLVGHRRGAFAGATHDHEGALVLARGGTVVLDRIESLPPALQARVQEILQTARVTPLGGTQPREVDVRLACTSNRDLEGMVRAGTFRDDLYRRLSAHSFRLPSLRERPEDITFLAEAFAAETAERFGVATRRFDRDAVSVLEAHTWPGNVTELGQAVLHAFAAASGEVISGRHLPVRVRAGARAAVARDPDGLPTIAQAEAELVALALEECDLNKTQAARRLGIDRKRLYRKIRRYRLLGAGELPPGEDEGDDD